VACQPSRLCSSCGLPAMTRSPLMLLCRCRLVSSTYSPKMLLITDLADCSIVAMHTYNLFVAAIWIS
jgi:hypothetical protein